MLFCEDCGGTVGPQLRRLPRCWLGPERKCFLRAIRADLMDRKDLVIFRPEFYRPVKGAKVAVDVKRA